MGVERVFFPEQSNQIPDRSALTFVVLGPKSSIKEEAKVFKFIDEMTQQYGKSARSFKSALVWIVADNDFSLYDEARKQIAWQAIQAEGDELMLDEAQKKQLSGHVKRAESDLKEAIWRTYKNIIFLGKDNKLKKVDLGLVHSSAAENLITLVMDRLRQDGEVEKDISPNFVVRNWPPAFVEWSTKSVRDAFFASPLFPRLLNAESLRDTIARGVESGILAYVGKTEDNKYNPFYYEETMLSSDIEFSDDMFIIQKSTAEEYRKNQTVPSSEGQLEPEKPTEGEMLPTSVTGGTPHGTPFPPEVEDGKRLSLLKWSGEVIPQKWMNFYTKVLSRFVTGSGLKLKIEIEVKPEEGISQQKVEQTRVALKELGVSEEIETKD